MSYPIDTIEGIGEVYAGKLKEAGISTTEQLLHACGTRSGRSSVAESTGISEKLILTWTNHADLMRINGIAGEFAELLEASGVDTVKELRTRNAENLAAKMVEVNAEKSLTRQVPVASKLQVWIDQAKELEPKVSY